MRFWQRLLATRNSYHTTNIAQILRNKRKKRLPRKASWKKVYILSLPEEKY